MWYIEIPCLPPNYWVTDGEVGKRRYQELAGHLNVMRTRRSLKKITQTTYGEHLLVTAVEALG